MGYRNGINRRDEYSLNFASVATTATMAEPDTDTEIDCRNAREIIVQADRSSTTFAGESMDIEIISRAIDATTYDTVPWHSITVIGSASVLSSTVPPGPAYMKIRANNNSSSAKVAAGIVVQVVA